MSINPEHNPATGDGRGPRPIKSILLENEILLMKLSAEFGARVIMGEEPVSPEIKNHFLRSVYAFEQKAAQVHDREIIYNRIGSPVCRNDGELSDEEVGVQLEWLLNRLYDHKIVLDTLAEYPDRQIYRFIINEFLHMEVDRLEPGDAVMHFCYEDFYPNHDFDLRQAARYFARFIMDQQMLVPQAGLYNRVRTSSGMLIGYKEALRTIDASVAEFVSRTLLAFEVMKVNILDDVAFLDFSVAYEVEMPDGEKLTISGDGSLEFVHSDELWFISFIRFPGVVI